LHHSTLTARHAQDHVDGAVDGAVRARADLRFDAVAVVQNQVTRLEGHR
jgi:hypothetical protein